MEEDNVLFIRNERGQGDSESNNMWDDTALIDAYDEAVNIAKDIVKRRLDSTGDSKNASSSDTGSHCPVIQSFKIRSASKRLQPKKENVYSVGDPCRCLYSVDGKIYEANVIDMGESGSCVVKYVGYENEEVVDISELRPSCGQAARDEQEREARLENVDANPYEDEYYNEHRASKRNASRASKSPRPRMDWESPDASKARVESRHFPRHTSMPLPQMTVPPPPPLNMLPAIGCPVDESDALSAMLMSWYMSGFHTGFYQGIKHTSNQDQESAHGRRTPTRRK